MDLKSDIAYVCEGYKYEFIIDVLEQLKKHYETCKIVSDEAIKKQNNINKKS